MRLSRSRHSSPRQSRPLQLSASWRRQRTWLELMQTQFLKTPGRRGCSYSPRRYPTRQRCPKVTPRLFLLWLRPFVGRAWSLPAARGGKNGSSPVSQCRLLLIQQSHFTSRGLLEFSPAWLGINTLHL